jgi:RNA polymerase sigma-70 factor (ECF subfamily)
MPDSAHHRSDEELVRMANRGDAEAFEALYDRYRDWVCSLAYRFCGDEAAAYDVVQTTFLYLFNKFPKFTLRSKLKTFLYPVVKHQALNLKKKAQRTEPLDSLPFEPIAADDRDEQTDRRAIREIVGHLPESQREIVLLRYADDLNLPEISEALDLPLGTVKSRLHKAIASLRKHLSTEI